MKRNRKSRAGSPRALAVDIQDVATICEALANATRLRLLLELAGGEVTVGDLCRRLRVPQPLVSHHLGVLRANGLARGRREGHSVRYSLTADQEPAGPAEFLVRLASVGGVTVSVQRLRPAAI